MAKDKIRQEESVDPVFQEVYVKLDFGRGEEFVLPRGIVNYYSLRNGDALHCELVELRDKTQAKAQPIGKDILVDVIGLLEFHGKFPAATFDLYGMENYRYALLRIKKKIPRER